MTRIVGALRCVFGVTGMAAVLLTAQDAEAAFGRTAASPGVSATGVLRTA